MKRHAHLDGLATGVLMTCCALWGFNQVAIKVAIAGISPVFGAGLRSIVAAGLLLLWSTLRGEHLLRRDGTLAHGMLIGLLFAIEFVFLYWGLVFTTASRSVVFLYAAPFFVALGAHFLVPGERLTRQRVLGLGLAFVGLCLAFTDALRLPTRTELVGDLLELTAAFFWGSTTVAIKRRSDIAIAPSKTLFYQLAVSGVTLVPLALVLGEDGIGDLTVPVVVAFAYQALVVAFASYLTWFWLLAHYPASNLAAFSFWTPLFGVGAGALLLGEPLSPGLGGAVVLVAGGIFLVNRPGGRREHPSTG
jgi:drug/metabolite transporter (DMT)-like permease